MTNTYVELIYTINVPYQKFITDWTEEYNAAAKVIDDMIIKNDFHHMLNRVPTIKINIENDTAKVSFIVGALESR